MTKSMEEYIAEKLDKGICPLCNTPIEIACEGDEDYDEHHNEVICSGCGFHYCITCEHIYGGAGREAATKEYHEQIQNG